MKITLNSLSDLRALPFDDIIDVRAPLEFAEDHLPGALNLPVLSDAQRAEVGTLYKQVSPFDARKLGAALVAENAARHLRETLSDRPGAWRPLVYCWRGGQRSNSFATILGQIGWRVGVIDGGYRSYRRMVAGALYDSALPHRLVLIDGPTGTGKTDLLHHLAQHGAQVIDLEGIYAHRGSVFGAVARPQPSQKSAEGQIAMQLAQMDPAQPVFLEAESSRIGARQLPTSLWHAMCAAPRIHITAPLGARASYLTRAYADLIADSTAMQERIAALHPHHGAKQVALWQGLASTGHYVDLAAQLMDQHYDARYAKSSARYDHPVLGQIDLGASIDAPALERAAKSALALAYD